MDHGGWIMGAACSTSHQGRLLGARASGFFRVMWDCKLPSGKEPLVVAFPVLIIERHLSTGKQSLETIVLLFSYKARSLRSIRDAEGSDGRPGWVRLLVPQVERVGN